MGEFEAGIILIVIFVACPAIFVGFAVSTLLVMLVFNGIN
jgi:hypothetical protein